MTAKDFATLPLGQPCLDNLAQLEYREMTPIQALALPPMLEGRDVLGQAGTGTGKTAAFGLALLARITPGQGRPGALVLCPTRELAAQVADELRRLARPIAHTKVLTLSGGSSIVRERASLAHGVDVVVGTPGRVQDHVVRGRLDLGGIRTLVLDEADRMLEMGFIDAVTAIASATPADRQTLLFSATFPDAVRALSASFQRDAIQVAAPEDASPSRVDRKLYELGALDRATALIRVLGHHRPASAVIFCNQRETCDVVAEALTRAGFAAVALHGGMDQHDRNTVLLLLRNGSLRTIVATDVAARGLDIDELAAVINYELPRDAAGFVHRIGRTARLGREGLAISLVGPADARALAELRTGPLAGVPSSPVPAPGSSQDRPPPPSMITIAIQGGRHDRLRPGDIVGALTADIGIDSSDIGQISVMDRISFVALAAAAGPRALAGLGSGRIKNKRFRAYLVTVPTGASRRSART
jgi:ATP-independent RNA helicase DbpA